MNTLSKRLKEYIPLNHSREYKDMIIARLKLSFSWDTYNFVTQCYRIRRIEIETPSHPETPVFKTIISLDGDIMNYVPALTENEQFHTLYKMHQIHQQEALEKLNALANLPWITALVYAPFFLYSANHIYGLVSNLLSVWNQILSPGVWTTLFELFSENICHFIIFLLPFIYKLVIRFGIYIIMPFIRKRWFTFLNG